ncbi:unnamed protein product [Mytilus coruscus]|uniref:B box-type domain-containing protein n=1 Tax=Mytilus coruscus TaxID=42192 RepID=A0A6J7ZW46_MYTCO|nr:unnamed protein product [Mytilus coruscus]
MASASGKNVCTLCQDDDVPSLAVTWCIECEVFLCIDCDKHHNKSRSFKHHKTMSFEDYHKLPACMLEISSQCQEHNKKFELYCSFHACPCCVQCVSKHRKCQDLKPLSDTITDVKSSALVQLLEKDFKVLKQNFDEILKYLRNMDDKRKIQKMKAIEEINTMRKSIDDYLNRLERQIHANLESKYSKLESKLNTLVKQIEHRSVEIHELQDDFSKMTRYATELQMYVGLRKMEKTTSEAAKYIESLKSGDHLKEINLDIKISSALQSILQDVKSFGDINITASCSTVKIKAGREDQAQLVHSFPGIEQIKSFLLKTVTMPEKIGRVDIFACSLLPDRKILILDNRGQRILLFSNDGIFMRTVLTFKDPPYDLCIIRNNTVAISFGTLKLSTLIDIDKNKIIKRI